VVANQILILFDNPLKNNESKMVKLLLHVFAPIAPAISVYLHARLAFRESVLLMSETSSHQQITDSLSFLEFHKFHTEIKSESQVWLNFYSNLRSNESATENLIQVIFLIIFILLKFSETSTVTGFQEIFAGKETMFLALSALWSFLSIILGFLNGLIIGKGQFMPMLGKLTIIMFSITSLVGRVSAIIIYFSPSLGLMNLLMHWKMGNKDAQEEQFDLNIDQE